MRAEFGSTPGSSPLPASDASGASGSAAQRERAGAADAAHDLLLALAGRLPDEVLWRLRDWLGAGATVALRSALPRTLLRHRVALTDPERVHLRTAVRGWDGPERLVDAVLATPSAPGPPGRFAGDAGSGGTAPDATDLALRAVVGDLGDVHELRRAWRYDPPARQGADPAPVRVLLVRAADRRPQVAAALARLLRTRGEIPAVEVLGPDADRTFPTPYHRDLSEAADALWVRPHAWAGDEGPEVGPHTPAPRREAGTELVGHG